MSLKLLFHIVAGISGIIAAICLASNSHNRIVLFIVFALISVILEAARPFIKLPPVKAPELKFGGHNT